MNPTHFDRLAVTVGQRATRRSVLGLLAALGLTGLVREDAVGACLVTGSRCGRGRPACCSGVCQGRRRRKTCRCPARICCECRSGGVAVSCSFVADSAQCDARCANQGATDPSSVENPQSGQITTLCMNKQCSRAKCLV
jgi:hypothetical protein